MIIQSLKLKNYRNYTSSEVRFDPYLNLITGENAQGKTNLLESLVLLSLTRSHRMNQDLKLIKKSESYADIQCVLEDRIVKHLRVLIHQNGKSLFIQKQPVKKSSEFIGILNVVLFSPDDMRIYTDPPKERRKIFNQEITKISIKYLNALSNYQTLLKRRNSLLKQSHPDLTYLDILDTQMIQESILIIKARKNFIRGINSFMEHLYHQLSDDNILACIKYDCCVENDENLEKSLSELYQSSRTRDLETHITNVGIHREDLIFELDGSNVIYGASQGQKRMTMLAFKIALLELIEETTKKKAVLLLDDVLSELDKIRQERLFQLVKNKYQCIITTTEKPDFLKNENLSEFMIKTGTITKVIGGNL